MTNIPFLKPNNVRKDDYIKYLEQIDASRIYSNYGTLNTLFEQRVLNEYFNNQGGVVTVSNATTGLILAIAQSKRPKGKYALMPSFTFPATPLAALWCGLTPYFVDIREDDWSMNEALLDKEIKKLGDEVAVIVPYATFGTNLNLSYYKKLQDHQISVVIDAASSFGSFSNSHFGQDFNGIVVYSFHATKAFGIGEGGIVYSGDKDTINKIRQAANFGFSDGIESVQLGLNGKLSEYAAAIGLATLDVFKQKKEKREKIYSWYLEELKNLELIEQGWCIQDIKGSVPQQFMSILCPERYIREHVVKKLEEKGIQTRSYFSPSCHQQKLFFSYPKTPLVITETIAQRILSLPLWEEMEREHVNKILRGITYE